MSSSELSDSVEKDSRLLSANVVPDSSSFVVSSDVDGSLASSNLRNELTVGKLGVDFDWKPARGTGRPLLVGAMCGHERRRV